MSISRKVLLSSSSSVVDFVVVRCGFVMSLATELMGLKLNMIEDGNVLHGDSSSDFWLTVFHQ